MNYNYNKFLSDSSDDAPKYEDGCVKYRQSDDDWAYRDAYKKLNYSTIEGCIRQSMDLPLEKDDDPYDHIEETERNKLLGQDEQLAEEDFLLAFREVIRLAKSAVQPWWTEEYKAKSETKINLIQEYFNDLKNKS